MHDICLGPFYLAKLKLYSLNNSLSFPPPLLAATILLSVSKSGQIYLEIGVPFNQVAQELAKNFSTYKLGNFLRRSEK